MRFASLGSGSDGNAWLVQATQDARATGRCLMIDCGFSVKAAVNRLERLCLAPSDIAGIVVTHEHDDHIGGVFKFSRRYQTPVYLTHGTWRAALESGKSTVDYYETGRVVLVDSHQPFECAGFWVDPFPVPHDAKEPIQLLIQNQLGTLGILTDCGSSTPLLVSKLKQADWLILELNHCPDKLKNSNYPESLKRRVGGSYGHLSNQVACEILLQVASSRLKYVVAAHLSKNTNCPHLVYSMLEKTLRPLKIHFDIACQEQGLSWWHTINQAEEMIDM